MIAVAIATMLPATSVAQYTFCSLKERQTSGAFIYDCAFDGGAESIWVDQQSWSYDNLSGVVSHDDGLRSGWGESYSPNCPDTLEVNNHTYRLLTLAVFNEDGETPTSYHPKTDTIYGCDYDYDDLGFATLIVPIYVREDWTVTFIANGGSVSPTSKAVTRKSAYGDLPTPTRTGYTSAGWYTVASGGTKITASSVYSLATNQTLYAQWTAKKSALTFDANGGSGTMTTGLSATYGSAMPTPVALPTRTGYTFAGYYDATSGGTQYYTAAGASARSWNKNTTSGTTLYAHWTAKQSALTFNTNGGSGTMTTGLSATYDSAMPTPINLPTRAGYTFAGFYDATSSETKYYNANGTSATTWNKNTTSGTTLYARWTANSYTVAFNANGGTGTMSNETFTYGTAKALTANSFTRTGYTFAGWATSASGAKVYNDKQSVSNLTATSGATVTLYATWTANTYTVTLDKQIGSGGTASVPATYNNNMPPIEVPTRNGYTFGGYYDQTDGAGTQYYSANGSSASVWDKAVATTLYAKWTAKTYTITFNANGGAGGTCQELEYGATIVVPTVTREGYTFSGWSPSVPATVSGDATYVAHWTVNKYTITFDANDGEGGSSTEMDYGAAIVAPTVTREGYTFSGWQPAVPDTVPASNATYVAQWIADLRFTITFEVEGGEFADPGTNSVNTVYTNGCAYGWLPMATKENHEFAGWWTSREPINRVQQLTTDTATNTISKLYARWKESLPMVTVSEDSNSTNVVWGTEFGDLKMIPSTVPDGKYFAWWCDTDGKPIADDYVVTNDITVTPQWSVADILRGEVAFEKDEWTYANGGFCSKDFTKANSRETKSLTAYLRYAGVVSFDYSARLAEDEENNLYTSFGWQMDDTNALFVAVNQGETQGSANVLAKEAIYWKIEGGGVNSIDDYAAISNIQYNIATSEWVDAWCSTNSGARTLTLVTPAEAGVLSFNWRVNGETGYVDTNGVYRLCDRLSFRELGGTSLRVEGFSEENGFTHVCVTNENASSHIFIWRYEKDYDCKAGDDAAWIKDIVWTPLAPSAEDTVIEYTSLDGTEMTVSIPNSWIDDRNLRTGEMSYSDAVSGISATSGLRYWAGYIIDEDPDAEFRITNFVAHAGAIAIGWAPNRPDRVYTIWGKTNLTDAAWHTPTNSATRFFTVEVSMPK